MAWESIDESHYRRVWPLPDMEPVDGPYSAALLSPYVTPEEIRVLMEEGP